MIPPELWPPPVAFRTRGSAPGRFGGIAEVQAKAGDIAGAFTIARGIPDDVVRAISLVVIAEVQVEVARQS